MMLLENILNDIDEEWDMPIELSHHYDMALFEESISTDHNHLLSVFFAE